MKLKTERVKIDLQVSEKRKSLHRFLRKFSLKSKRKVKRLYLYLKFILLISQPLGPYGCCIIVPLSPFIERNIEQNIILSNKNPYHQFAVTSKSKVHRIRLTNAQLKQFKNLGPRVNSGSITLEKAVLQLRGGDETIYLVVILAFVIFVNWLESSYGAQAFPANPLPNQDPLGWLSGKYHHKPSPYISYKSSRFDLEMSGISNNMCPGMKDENGFVMDYEKAYSLVAETYPSFLKVDENLKITDWQAAKHIYHANGMGVNIGDYNFTQQELERIRGEAGYKGGGLIAYARRGHRLPPIEMIQDYQLRLKISCENAHIKKTGVPYYDINGVSNATVFAIRPSKHSSGIIIAFNESTGDLITGDKQNRSAFDRFEKKNYLGGNKWMLKWSNK